MNKSRQTEYIGFIKENWKFLSFGILLACISSLGQTWFIGLFTPNIEASFGLSHSEWGSIYMIGTLLSAAVLTYTGSFLDKLSLRLYSLLVCLLLSAACAAIAVSFSIWFLILAIFMLRQTGQGLATHIAVTGMVKHFQQDRGKAVAIASIGFPAGRALLPIFVTGAIVAIGWRETYLVCSIFLLVILIPTSLFLLRGYSRSISSFNSKPNDNVVKTSTVNPQPTLKQTLQKPLIYLIIPALIAPSFFDTALSFHLLPVAELKSWPIKWVATGYTVYGVATIASSIWVGSVIDQYGSKRIFVYSLIPYLLGLMVLSTFSSPFWAWIYLGLFGLGSGLRMTIVPVVLSEFFGTTHIGSIRAFVATLGVVASALGPPILGFALDHNTSITVMTAVAISYFALSITLAFVGIQNNNLDSQP